MYHDYYTSEHDKINFKSLRKNKEIILSYSELELLLFISPEPEIQVSFSDNLFSVVRL